MEGGGTISAFHLLLLSKAGQLIGITNDLVLQTQRHDPCKLPNVNPADH